MAKIRRVFMTHPDHGTVTIISLKGRLKLLKAPVGGLWPDGLCRIEGDSAYPIIPKDEKPDVLVVKDGKD